MIEDHVFDLLPGYALGCLDEEDLLQVARHLPRCQICRDELSTYFATVDLLPLAVPLRTPPPALKGEILNRIESGRSSIPDEPKSRSIPAEDNQRRQRQSLGDFLRSLRAHPGALALGALALLLLVFLSVTNWMLWRQVNDLQARMPATDIQLVHLQGTENAPLATGYLMIFPAENYGTLVVEDVPALDPGYQYQLWLIRDGKRTSGGVFSVDAHGYGSMQISSDRPLDTFPSFGVTVEPEGGSPGPTGAKVLGGDL